MTRTEKKALTYDRYSPRPNADKCKSGINQRKRCIAYCESKGYEVVGSFSDNKTTGRILYRTGLSSALAALTPGMVLVADANDRLARDLWVNLTIRHEVENKGCTIEFADGTPSTDTPEGELSQNILAAFAAYERAKFSRRTREGLAKKKARGEHFGRVPIGFRVDPTTKRLTEEESEQCAMKYAIHLHDSGHTSSEIAVEVDRIYGHFRGRVWSPRTIRKVISMEKVRVGD